MAEKIEKKGMVSSFIEKFTVLKTAPRELWIIYLAKILEIAAYAIMSTGLILYLSADLHFSDLEAGAFIGYWSVGITFVTFFAGALTDVLGIKRTFIWGFAICLFARAVMTFFDSPPIIPILFGFIPLAVGLALMVPVMTAACKRYSNKDQRSMAFSLYYVLMNVGFIIGGKLFDVIRTHMGEHGTYVIPLVNIELSVYQTIFFISFLFTIPGFLLTAFFMRDGVEMPEDGEQYIINPKKKMEGGVIKTVKKVAKDTGGIFKELFSERDFYRFLLFLTLIVLVRVVFYHMHYTFPKYADRELGFGARIGTVWGVLNPLLIVILVPIIGAVTQKISSYKMIVVGTFLSALPVFILSLPDNIFDGAMKGWIGQALGWFLDIDGPVPALYLNITIFVIIFSIGEAIWSPRLYEYTASVAPKEREGSYMGMSLLPYFVAKLVVGPLSGWLLALYCPEEGARNSQMLWFIIAAIAVVGPISIVMLKNVIKPKSREEEDAGSSSASAASSTSSYDASSGESSDGGEGESSGNGGAEGSDEKGSGEGK